MPKRGHPTWTENMTVLMEPDLKARLKAKLLEDGLTVSELCEVFLQSYVRGDRICRLLLGGHRDARVVGSPPKDGLLTQRDREEIMRELEKGDR